MTMRYTGGGHKQRYRIIVSNVQRRNSATVKSIEYDPNRTAFIAIYALMVRTYVIASKRLKVGQN
jgi:large subunit ribosomal protein L2